MGLDGDAPNCSSCGDGQGGQPNPIDGCSRDQLQCDNPCHAVIHNTVACESLPSRVENFTKNFFGDVVRTEVNGQIVWSLPCGLDVGLPNNPRGIDEGLACYFLRLFNDGIIGLTGPSGLPGATGQQGHNAYTVTLAPFVTPAVGRTVQVQTLFNPGILLNSFVLVDGSGFYEVVAKNGGLLTLLLLAALPGSGFVSSGKLIVPSGEPGNSIPGSKGDKGDTGPPGANGQSGLQGLQGNTGLAGNNFLATNGTFSNPGAADYNISSAAYANVTFGGNFGFTAPFVGTYFIACAFDFIGIAVANGNSAIATITNVTLGTQPLGAFTEVGSSQVPTGGEISASMQAMITTTAPNQVICVQAQYNAGAGAYSIKASTASLSWMQIA